MSCGLTYFDGSLVRAFCCYSEQYDGIESTKFFDFGVNDIGENFFLITEAAAALKCHWQDTQDSGYGWRLSAF